MGDNFGIHRGTSRQNSETERGQGQILSDFLIQLEDYTPTVWMLIILSQQIDLLSLLSIWYVFQIPDAVSSYFLNSSGFDASDPRM